VANVLLAFQNRTDEGTLSGGSWLASLPLVNLQNRLVQRVARSTNAANASTKFDLNLGAAKNVGVLALVVHNMSVSAKVRITGDDDAAFTAPVYQSAWIDVWPSGMIPQSLLEWEDDNFWLGTLSAQARAGYQSPFIHVLPSANTLQYWRVEIDDTSNSDGYVHIGRLFISPTWRPAINYSLGADLVYRDTTPVETSLSGAEFFDQRSKVREFSFTLEGMTATEAYDYALQLQRQVGISGEILQVPDTDDTARIPARAYVGRLVSLSPIGNPQGERFRTQFTVRELV
jgi:hypothetical protein